MEYYTHEFDNFIAELQSPEAYKKLRPGFMTKHNLYHSSLSDLSMIVVKTRYDRIEFELTTLFKDLLYCSESLKTESLIPYQYRINGHFKDDKIVYSSLETSLRGVGKDGNEHDSDFKISNADPIEHSDLIDMIESELNGNFNCMTDEEKTLFILEGRRTKGEELIRQLNAIAHTFRTISERASKREKVFRVINYLIGQWIQANDLPRTHNKATILASSLFNGCATYQLATLYLQTLIMIL